MLCFLLLFLELGPERLPSIGDLVLKSDQGSILVADDLLTTRTLILKVSELSETALSHARLLQDLEHDQFRVVLVGELISDVRWAYRLSDLEVFADTRRVFGNNSYYYFNCGLKLEAFGIGLPDSDRVLEWAAHDLATNYGLGNHLGDSYVTLQNHRLDCAAASTVMLTQRLGLDLGAEDVFGHLDPGPDTQMVSLLDIKKYLLGRGIPSSGWRSDLDRLRQERLPVLLHFGNHFVVLAGVFDKGVLVLDPASGRELIPLPRFHERWTGIYLRIDET